MKPIIGDGVFWADAWHVALNYREYESCTSCLLPVFFSFLSWTENNPQRMSFNDDRRVKRRTEGVEVEPKQLGVVLRYTPKALEILFHHIMQSFSYKRLTLRVTFSNNQLPMMTWSPCSVWSGSVGVLLSVLCVCTCSTLSSASKDSVASPILIYWLLLWTDSNWHIKVFYPVNALPTTFWPRSDMGCILYIY